MMSFSEYMTSLSEDFDHTSNQSDMQDFGDENPNTSAGTSDNMDEADLDLDDDLGDIRFDTPDKFGYDSAKDAADQFVAAGDIDPDEDLAIDDMYDEMANIVNIDRNSIDNLSSDAKHNLREAVEFILNTINEEYETNGEDPDDYIDDDGVDTNTIVPHNSEMDQFSEIDDTDNELEESATGWADLF